MKETLIQYGAIFLASMIPVSELRGAIPAGIAMGLNPWATWLICVVGNFLPAPFIILFIRKIFAWMNDRGGRMARIVTRMEEKADKAARMFYRYELGGLFLLVAIPLPGTGAWTGALVASMLNLRLKTALPAIAAGVVAAGLAVLALSCGVVRTLA